MPDEVTSGQLTEALDATFEAGRLIGVAQERMRAYRSANDPDGVELAAVRAAVDQSLAAIADVGRLADRLV